MENKIIELSNVEPGYRTCLLCCDNPADTKLTIKRVKYDDTVTSFNICNECLTKMKMDIKACE